MEFTIASEATKKVPGGNMYTDIGVIEVTEFKSAVSLEFSDDFNCPLVLT